MAAHIQLRWFQFKFLNEPSPHLKLSRPGKFETIKLESYMGEASSAAEKEITANVIPTLSTKM